MCFLCCDVHFDSCFHLLLPRQLTKHKKKVLQIQRSFFFPAHFIFTLPTLLKDVFEPSNGRQMLCFRLVFTPPTSEHT